MFTSMVPPSRRLSGVQQARKSAHSTLFEARATAIKRSGTGADKNSNWAHEDRECSLFPTTRGFNYPRNAPDTLTPSSWYALATRCQEFTFRISWPVPSSVLYFSMSYKPSSGGDFLRQTTGTYHDGRRRAAPCLECSSKATTLARRCLPIH